MNIIIVGTGKVGFTLAEMLVQEAHSVTIVDIQEDALRHAADTMDLMTIRGNGVSPAVLREAGVAQTDLFVAATSEDEVNMVCCRTAKNLGAHTTIARIRNPEYATGFESLKANMGIDIVVNPENAAAVEISRLLRFPSAANIDTFCRGRVELMSFRLREEDFMVGKPLWDLPHSVRKLSLLICAVERGDEVIIPGGDFVPQVGDRIHLMGRPVSLDRFFHILGRHAPQIKNVLLIGGGKISLYLAALLQPMKIQVKIIEQNLDRCRYISEVLPDVNVICGDGTDQTLLEAESLSDRDAFVALTDRDEDNLIISLYAMQQKMGKVIAKCNRQNYASIARSVGLDSIISPKVITAEHILQVVRGMQNSYSSVMSTLYRIADGRAEVMEFLVPPGAQKTGILLKNLGLKPGILIAVIIRDNDILIPDDSSSFLEGDSIIIISRSGQIAELDDIYRGGDLVSSGGPSA